MKKNMTPLTANDIETFKKNHDIISVGADIDIVYEKQLPIAGLVLIQGELEFIKKSKILEKTNSSCAVGLYEAVNGIPVQVGCRVKKDSEIIFLGKFELLNAMEEKSEIFPYIRKFLKG